MKAFAELLNKKKAFGVDVEVIVEEYLRNNNIVDPDISIPLRNYATRSYATVISFSGATSAQLDKHIEWRYDLREVIVSRILYTELRKYDNSNTTFEAFIANEEIRKAVKRIKISTLFQYLKALKKVDFYQLIIDDILNVNEYNDQLDPNGYYRDNELPYKGFKAIMNTLAKLREAYPTFRVIVSSLSKHPFSVFNNLQKMNERLITIRLERQDVKIIYNKLIESNSVLQSAGINEKRKITTILVSCSLNANFLDIMCRWLRQIKDIREVNNWKAQLPINYELSRAQQYELLIGDLQHDGEKWKFLSGFHTAPAAGDWIPIAAPILFTKIEGFNYIDIQFEFKTLIQHWIPALIETKKSSSGTFRLGDLFQRSRQSIIDNTKYGEKVKPFLPSSHINTDRQYYLAYNLKSFKDSLNMTLHIVVSAIKYESNASIDNNYCVNSDYECQIITCSDGEPGMSGLIANAKEKVILVHQEISVDVSASTKDQPINFKAFTESIIWSCLNLYPFLHDNWTVSYLMLNSRSCGSDFNAAKWFNDTQAASEEEEEGRLKAHFDEATHRLLSSDSMMTDQRYKQFIAEYAGGDAVKFTRFVSSKALEMFRVRSGIVNPCGLRVMLGGQVAFILESYQALAEDNYYQ